MDPGSSAVTEAIIAIEKELIQGKEKAAEAARKALPAEEAPAPARRDTPAQPAPTRRETPAPVQTRREAPAQPAPAKREAPAPVQTRREAPEQPAPVRREAPAPVQTRREAPAQPAPAKRETPAPVQTRREAPEQPAPVKREAPAPVQTRREAPEQPAPVRRETPAPVQTRREAPEQPAPVKREAPAPVLTRREAPVQPTPARRESMAVPDARPARVAEPVKAQRENPESSVPERKRPVAGPSENSTRPLVTPPILEDEQALVTPAPPTRPATGHVSKSLVRQAVPGDAPAPAPVRKAAAVPSAGERISVPDPHNVKNFFEMAEEALSSGDEAGAVGFLKKAKAEAPDDPEVRSRIMNLQRRIKAGNLVRIGQRKLAAGSAAEAFASAKEAFALMPQAPGLEDLVAALEKPGGGRAGTGGSAAPHATAQTRTRPAQQTAQHGGRTAGGDTAEDYVRKVREQIQLSALPAAAAIAAEGLAANPGNELLLTFVDKFSRMGLLPR